MKIRQGFVSNSSSSSFIIEKKYLTSSQVKKIVNHIKEAKEVFKDIEWWRDEWNIRVFQDVLIGKTSMDNFDMRKFLKRIGVDEDHIEWLV